MNELHRLIGKSFNGECPVCGNKRLGMGENVYCEGGDIFYNFYRPHCDHCGTTYIVREKEYPYYLNQRGEEVDYHRMNTCPNCGCDCIDADEQYWREVPEWGVSGECYGHTCPDCGTKFWSMEAWEKAETSIYAVKDKFGNIYKGRTYLGDTAMWTGDSVEKHLSGTAPSMARKKAPLLKRKKGVAKWHPLFSIGFKGRKRTE